MNYISVMLYEYIISAPGKKENKNTVAGPEQITLSSKLEKKSA